MDWRHIDALIDIGRELYGALLNVVVWAKSNPGQGSFYRSQHELICVFRVGGAPHRNNVELGRFGRNRSNVWTYRGVNSFGRGRLETLCPSHREAGRTGRGCAPRCTARDIVLDQFAGSGTTVLAAEKTAHGLSLEYEAAYVDVAIRRWQKATKLEAMLDGDGRTFAEIAEDRRVSRCGPAQSRADSEDLQDRSGAVDG